jgi:K+-transporting ATPase KdpF subunit
VGIFELVGGALAAMLLVYLLLALLAPEKLS